MVDFAFSSTDTKSERFRFSVESPSATDGVDAEILESGTATKNQFRPRLCSPQRNEPVLEAANFTFLRGWAKIAMFVVVDLLRGPPRVEVGCRLRFA